MRPDAQLARLLAARLCHDLGGAVGALSGTLSLVADPAGDAEMLELSRATAATLHQRLLLCAAAWGGAGGDQGAAALAAMLAAAPAAPRVTFDLAGLSPGADLPAALVPLALNAALLGAEALPRGGTVLVAGDAAQGLCILPTGRGAAWPPGLAGLIAGDPLAAALAAGPRRVVAPLLAVLAAEAGWALSFALPAGKSPPALLLGPA
jgi:histidine phosphotransferase ChpT